MSEQEPLYNRHLRIACDPNRFDGSAVSITDVQTGEALQDLTEVVIHIKPSEVNEIYLHTCLFPADPDDQGYFMLSSQSIKVDIPEIAITALERIDKPARIYSEQIITSILKSMASSYDRKAEDEIYLIHHADYESMSLHAKAVETWRDKYDATIEVAKRLGIEI